MNQEDHENQDVEQEELTAYLDGELDPQEQLLVEQRLNSDPEYLAQMQALQKTWELFDQLPASHSDDAFVRTTMAMVVQDAVQQVARKKNKPWIWPMRTLLFASVTLLLFTIGYATTRIVKMTPHRELLNNLRLIENLDYYEALDMDFSFLTKLDQWGLFAEDKVYVNNSGDDLPADLFAYDQPGVFPPRETIEHRQQRLDAMSLEQKNELRRSYDRYTKLAKTQQEQLQNFNNELSQHPDRDHLTHIMNAYYDWLTTLGLSTQAILRDMPREKRLLEISNIKSRQAREAFGRSGSTRLPTTRDAEHLFDWYELSINSQENQIRNRFPAVVAEFQNKHESKRPIPMDLLSRFASRQPINQLIAILIRIDRKMIEDLVLQNIDLLRRGLSFEARAILDDQSPAEQKELVLNWIDAANQAQATIGPERLQAFYEQLSLEERDELDMMAPENWINALTAKYWEYHNADRNRIPFDRLDDWESFFEDNNLGGFSP